MENYTHTYTHTHTHTHTQSRPTYLTKGETLKSLENWNFEKFS